MNTRVPAFPTVETERYEAHPGMSLLDWFAGMAMQGYLASIKTEDYRSDPWPEYDHLAHWSYGTAQAMLARREKLAILKNGVDTEKGKS